MIFHCPECCTDTEIDNEDLPSNACDDMEYECPECKQGYIVGWVAEVEVRGRI